MTLEEAYGNRKQNEIINGEEVTTLYSFPYVRQDDKMVLNVCKDIVVERCYIGEPIIDTPRNAVEQLDSMRFGPKMINAGDIITTCALVGPDKNYLYARTPGNIYYFIDKPNFWVYSNTQEGHNIALQLIYKQVMEMRENKVTYKEINRIMNVPEYLVKQASDYFDPYLYDIARAYIRPVPYYALDVLEKLKDNLVKVSHE